MTSASGVAIVEIVAGDPCTEGGAPSDRERLLGFVKLGITQSPMRSLPRVSAAASQGIAPAAIARSV
jgi:hypothetical protein